MSEAGETDAADSTARSGDRLRRRLAILLAVISVLEALGMVAFGSRGDPRFSLGLDFVTIGFLGTVVLFSAIGALIITRRPRTPVAWVMIGMGTLFGAGLLAGAYSSLYVTSSGESEAPFAFELLLLAGLAFVPTLGIGTTSLLLLYPSDALLSRRWRIALGAAVLGAIAWDVDVLFHPGFIGDDSLSNVPNPFGAGPELLPVFELLPPLANILILAAILAAAACLFVRYRRGDSIVRAQIRWIGLIAAAVFVFLVLATVVPSGDLFFGLAVTAIACLPIAIGVAITRYRLYDIDLIINRALVYGSLTAILAGVFTAGAALAQRLFVTFTGQSSDAALVLATLVIATLYAPLRKRIEAVIDRRFKYESSRFGSYRDKVKSVLAVISPMRAAESLAREAVSELGAVGVAVLDGAGAAVATAGTWPLPTGAATTTVEISDRGPLCSIVVGPTRGGHPHTPTELAALQEVGRLTAEAVGLG